MPGNDFKANCGGEIHPVREQIGTDTILFGTVFDSVYAWEFHPNIATRMESF